MGTNRSVYFLSISVACLFLGCLYTVGHFQVNLSELRADLDSAEQKIQQLQPNSLHRSKRYVKTAQVQTAVKDDFVEQYEEQQSQSLNNRLFFVEQKLEQFVTKVVVQLKGTQSAQQSQLIKIQEKFSHIFEQLKKYEETLPEVVSKLIVVEAQLSQYSVLSKKVTKLEALEGKSVHLAEGVAELTEALKGLQVRVEKGLAEFQQKFDNLALNLSHYSAITEKNSERQNKLQSELEVVQKQIVEHTQLFENLHQTKEQAKTLVVNFQEKFDVLEKNLSQSASQCYESIKRYNALQEELAEVEKSVSQHKQSIQDAQAHETQVHKTFLEIQEKLANLGRDVTQYSNEQGENFEELQKRLHEVEEKVFKHAGLFKDMYAAQTEVSQVIPEVSMVSKNFTLFLSEYYTKNERNLKVREQFEEKLSTLENRTLEQSKLFKNVHILEVRADELVLEFQQKLKTLAGDLSQCTKKNNANLQVQEKLQHKVDDVEHKLSDYESLKQKIRDFEEFELILLKVVDLGKVLYIAVNQNDSATFNALIKLDVSLDFQGEKGITPLIAAIRYFRNDFVKVLLEKGAKVNARDHEKKSALHWAAGVNNVIGAQHLVEKGADINILDVELKSPLSLAAMLGHVEVLEFLIEKGADVEQKDELSARAIHWATTMGHAQCVRSLLNAGADINSESGHQTPLLLAAKAGQFEILKLLLERKALVDCVDAQGNTPLIIASETGHLECVQTLLDYGAGIEHRNRKQETALMIVARKGFQDILTLLLDKGAQTTSVDSAGNNALFFAQKGGHTTCIKILMLRGVAK